MLRSSRLGDPIARGGRSEIYALGGTQVVKFYDREVDEGEAEREAMFARLARESGACTPEVGASVVHDAETGRVGLVMSRVQGVPLVNAIIAKPWRMGWASREFASAMCQLHSCVAVAGFDHQHEWLASNIEGAQLLDTEWRARMLRRLRALPSGDRLCHGDFHPGNLLLGAGRTTLIDWPNALIGNPVGDLARSWLLMRFPLRVDVVYRTYLRLFARAILRACMREGMSLPHFRDWVAVNAAARIGELGPFMDMGHMAAWLQRYERRWLLPA